MERNQILCNTLSQPMSPAKVWIMAKKQAKYLYAHDALHFWQKNGLAAIRQFEHHDTNTNMLVERYFLSTTDLLMFISYSIYPSLKVSTTSWKLTPSTWTTESTDDVTIDLRSFSCMNRTCSVTEWGKRDHHVPQLCLRKSWKPQKALMWYSDTKQ